MHPATRLSLPHLQRATRAPHFSRRWKSTTAPPSPRPARRSSPPSSPPSSSDPDRTAQQGLALTHALKKIDSQFGKGSVMKLGERVAVRGEVEVVPTGSLSLDEALGVGGLPVGRVVEIFGPEASGKTSLALSVIGQAQRMGGKCVFVDAEHALDPKFAKAMGVDVNELYIAQPDSGEQALEIVDTLLRSGAVKVIVVDSVAALVPRAELEGEMGDAHMGMQARLMSQALRKLTGSVNKAGALLIFINQIRNKLGVVFGNPEVTAGGHALRYYTSVRLDVRRAEFIKEDGVQVGTVQRVKVVKNKLAPPFGVAEYAMRFGRGIDRVQELLDVSLKRGVVELKGNTYSFLPTDASAPGDRVTIAVGRAKALKALATDSALHAQLLKRFQDHVLKHPVVPNQEEEGGGGSDGEEELPEEDVVSENKKQAGE